MVINSWAPSMAYQCNRDRGGVPRSLSTTRLSTSLATFDSYEDFKNESPPRRHPRHCRHFAVPHVFPVVTVDVRA